MKRYIGLDGLGSDDRGAQIAIATASAASASIAAGGATASALIAAGVSAQAVPVIGQVLGAIALVGGYMLQARAKANAIKSRAGSIETQNQELRTLVRELDTQIIIGQQSRANVRNEITRLGLGGGLAGNWFNNTFRPAAMAERTLKSAEQEQEQLTRQVEERQRILAGIKEEFEQLYQQLTTGTRLQNIVLWGGIAAASLGILYWIFNLSKS